MSWREELLERKRRAIELIETGMSWQEANERSGLNYSRRGIQQLYQRWGEYGDEALIDHRHGHSYKATAEVQEWMSKRCQENSEVRSTQLASEIEAQFGVELHPGYVTLLRRQLGLPVPRPGRPGIKREAAFALQQAQDTASEEGLGQVFPPQ